MDRYFKKVRGVRDSIDLDGNMSHVAFKLLTGKGGRNRLSDTFGRIPDFWFSDSQIDNFNKPGHVAVVGSTYKDKDALSYNSSDGHKFYL